jgi:sugar O-acyltransferase (sialic acid O-acetyltransferase NeuD family)
MNAIFGAGGVAREVAWMLHEVFELTVNDDSPNIFVVADKDWIPGQRLAGTPVVSQSTFFENHARQSPNIFLALGLPRIKQRALSAIPASMECSFPNMIHPKSSMDRRPGKITFGRGVIVYPGASLTTDISIGDFVHVNPGATVAHESKIGNFSTLCPGSHVSGRVTIGPGCFIGAGAVIREGVSIASGCTIGAGAVVVKSIAQPGIWVGIPARRLDV